MTNKLTTIIATRNRADALKGISLPSLLGQNCSDFEIIVWDASDGEDSRDICESFAPDFKNRGIDLRYFRASRVGSASQRNDAVKEAEGDFIFFIDDDCEVSADGIGILIKAFGDNPDRMGIGLLFEDFAGGLPTIYASSIYVRFLRSIRKYVLFLISPLTDFIFGRKKCRYISILGTNARCSTHNEPPGDAEWLQGGDMAFRREVFDHISFDERLQKFGGYAVYEDADFSHRVMILYKKNLLVVSHGLVRHFCTPGNRIKSTYTLFAATFFNKFILRSNFGMGIKKNIFCFHVVCFDIFIRLIVTFRVDQLKAMLKGMNIAKLAIDEEAPR